MYTVYIWFHISSCMLRATLDGPSQWHYMVTFGAPYIKFSSTTEAHLISFRHSLVYSFIFAVPKFTGLLFHVSHPTRRSSITFQPNTFIIGTLHTYGKSCFVWGFEGFSDMISRKQYNFRLLDYIMFALGVKGRILGSQNVSKSTTKNRKYCFMLDQIQALWRVLMMHVHSLCSISQKHLSTASHYPENPERGYAATARNKNLKMCCVLIILK